MNISSIVVKTAPEQVKPVMDNLRLSGLCEVHFHDEQGRIVATIEGRDVGEEMAKLKAIQGLPRVLSAELAYAYSENELDEAIKNINAAGKPVPDALRE